MQCNPKVFQIVPCVVTSAPYPTKCNTMRARAQCNQVTSPDPLRRPSGCDPKLPMHPTHRNRNKPFHVRIPWQEPESLSHPHMESQVAPPSPTHISHEQSTHQCRGFRFYIYPDTLATFTCIPNFQCPFGEQDALPKAIRGSYITCLNTRYGPVIEELHPTIPNQLVTNKDFLKNISFSHSCMTTRN